MKSTEEVCMGEYLPTLAMLTGKGGGKKVINRNQNIEVEIWGRKCSAGKN